MEVMLVEDDEFKAADITRVISDAIDVVNIYRTASVNSALKGITTNSPPLILRDMSLPTFDLSGPGGGGSPQSQGGIEVLRLSKRLKKSAAFIIITQYPGIEINGVEIPLKDAAKALCSKFAINVQSCIKYDFESDEWRYELINALSKSSNSILG
jgi:CheY-like chemotaxis protein